MRIPTRKPLRLWPGVIAACLLLLAKLISTWEPDAVFAAGVAGMICALAIIVWWLLFSRAPWSERLGAIVLMALAVYAVSHVVHVSIRTGMRGMMLPVYAIRVLSIALVVWAVASQRLSAGVRRATMVAALLLTTGAFALLRTGGIKGGGSELAWRWTKTPEERLLARTGSEPPAPAAAPKAAATAPPEDKRPIERKPPAPAPPPAEWPGFRGPERDSIIRGVRITTDWPASPPVEMWRRPVGPGWSSFAVRGDFSYTQEQRGDDEIVACYRVSTGEPVWKHRDPVRFWESNGGAGPRSTPTLSNGHIFALGATGILNALDAATGKLIWSRNIASDTGRQVPEWGFASSPLVVDGLVVAAASGTLAAYDIANGNPRWTGRRQLGSYSSPHLATIDGVAQVVLLSGSGAAGFATANGAVLWEHGWQAGGSTMVQPAVIANGDFLINAIAMAGGAGIRRIAVAHKADGWSVEERWTSNGLKPYFNDFVVHKGHAFGFDGSILACIDLEDGKRKWKGGRYGNGQLVLLHDQDLLLVLSEEGELALVGATTDGFKEIARLPVLTGKTWNHPSVAGDILLVRNGEEMAAFRLPLAGR